MSITAKKKPASPLRKAMLITAFIAAVGGGGTLLMYNPKPAAPPPPPEPAPAATIAFQDRNAPEACAALSDFKAVAQKIPQTQMDLAILSNLPLTGKHIYEQVTAPENKISGCLYPIAEGKIGDSNFNPGSKIIRHGRPNGTTVFAHEALHSVQHIQTGGFNIIERRLTMQDALTAEFLKEANAVGYQLIVAKEAALSGVPLVAHASNTAFAADHPQVKATFEAAYAEADKLFAKDYPKMDAKTRETAALQAGGQAVVRYLMQGQNEGWKNSYQKHVLDIVNGAAKPGGLLKNDGREKQPGYAAFRTKLFGQLGRVSDSINLTPPEFMRPDAPQHIAQSNKALGVYVPASSAPKQPLPTS